MDERVTTTNEKSISISATLIFKFFFLSQDTIEKIQTELGL